jgi:hypothetical protein
MCVQPKYDLHTTTAAFGDFTVLSDFEGHVLDNAPGYEIYLLPISQQRNPVLLA